MSEIDPNVPVDSTTSEVKFVTPPITPTTEVATPASATAATQAVAAEPVVVPEATQETTETPDAPFKTPGVKHQRVQGDPPKEPLVSEAKNDGIVVGMPSALSHVVAAAQEHLSDNFVPDPQWSAVAEMGELTNSNGEFEEALSDPDRDWLRIVEHNGKRMTAQNLTTASISGKELSGGDAVMAFRSHSRGSAGASIYLWGSGISMKFNALPDESLYHLSREIASSRITAGRSTYAIALSQHMVYTAEAMLEAAKSALWKSSLQKGVDLGDVIRVTDFLSMVWGLAVATFPHGFDIERACTASPGKCQHVARERVNVRRMQIVDWSAISQEQRTWMAGLQEHKHSLKDVLPYQDMFAKAQTRDYPVDHPDGSQTVFTLKVPTLNEFIASGKLWVDNVNRNVVTSIGESASFAQRNKMMEELMQISNALQYSHWVEAISFGGGKVTDREAIGRILSEEISSDNFLLKAFMDGVRDYSNKVSCSVIVINNYKCPVCNKHQMEDADHLGEDTQPPIYVPVEAVSTFFALMYQKLGSEIG